MERIYNHADSYSKKFHILNYIIRNLYRKINDYFLLKINISEELDNIDFQEVQKKLDLPTRSAIEINNTCNLNCLACNTNSSTRPKGYITPQMFELILKQLKKIGFNRVALHTVGEPLLYKNLDNLFEIIKRYNFSVSLSTNGQLPKQLKLLISHHSRSLKYIRFSIDGATPETYEKIRKGARFDRLIESLEIVHNFNRNKINYFIPVKIDSIVNLTNINELSLFFKVYGKYCWPDSINFNLISGLSPDTNYFWETFPFPNLIKKVIPCKMPFTDIYFTYDGKATLCCRDYNGELIVGDLNKNSIIEIWNGEKSESLRKQHSTGNVAIKLCNQCYAPYSFLAVIVNKYIHYLNKKYPKLSSEKFGKRILTLIKDLDKVMEERNKDLIKKCVLKHFNQ